MRAQTGRKRKKTRASVTLLVHMYKRAPQVVLQWWAGDKRKSASLGGIDITHPCGLLDTIIRASAETKRLSEKELRLLLMASKHQREPDKPRRGRPPKVNYG